MYMYILYFQYTNSRTVKRSATRPQNNTLSAKRRRRSDVTGNAILSLPFCTKHRKNPRENSTKRKPSLKDFNFFIVREPTWIIFGKLLFYVLDHFSEFDKGWRVAWGKLGRSEKNPALSLVFSWKTV